MPTETTENFFNIGYIPRLDQEGNVDPNSFNNYNCIARIVMCGCCKKVLNGCYLGKKEPYCSSCVNAGRIIRKKETNNE